MDSSIYEDLKRIHLFLILLLFCATNGYSQDKPEADTLMFHLPDVVVTAIESKSPGSVSLLPASAIEHIQPTSAADLMQLLPGGLTGNSGFTSPMYFTVRDIPFLNGNNILTAEKAESMQIVMDGSPLHRNANISSPYSGGDTRFISMNEIEQVEIVRGIPSAQYGNLTNGLMKIRTRTGEMPFTLGIRYNPDLKQYTLGKGYRISPAGTLNLLADYSTQNYFHVGGLRLANSYQWMPGGQPLLLNLSYTSRIGREKTDINNEDHSRMKYLEQRLSLGSEWKPGRKLLQSLSLRIDLSAIKSSRTDEKVSRGSVQSAAHATISGEWQAEIVPSNYRYQMQTEDLPIYVETEVIASTRLPLPSRIANSQVQLKAGINWRSEGNRGDGTEFDLHFPPGYSMRPRSYRDTPFLHNGSAFAEALFLWPRLTVQAGMRYQGQISQEYPFLGSAEPRLNLIWTTYTSAAYRLRIKAGVGLMGYMPTTDRLYPEPIYHDRTSFYYNDAASGNALAVVTTHVPEEIRNKELRPTINRKVEAGFLLETPVVNLDVTTFYERQTGGFTTVTDYLPFSYRKYDQLTATGLKPEYRDGQVLVGGEAIPYKQLLTFTQVVLPVNATLTRKQGIEFTADFGTFHPLRTSLIVDGMWLRIHRSNTALTGYSPQSDVNGQTYPYAGFYDKIYTSSSNQTTTGQFSTNCRFITRIPKLGLVTTLTWQMVWMHRNWISYNGDTPEEVWPLFWCGSDGIRRPFTEAEKENPDFALLKQTAQTRSFLQDSYTPYGLFNLRVSKEFTRFVTLSFFANNLGNIHPSRYKRSTETRTTQNPHPFFGLEMQVKL